MSAKLISGTEIRTKILEEIKAEVTEIETVYEPFTIEFQLQDDKTNLLMMWDKTKASFTIDFLD